ncbi:DUF1854 domain-containing protein [Paenibacillus sp. HJGM_3]|uniref:DUF1854 domain-containing protein n=1 Tax=Paenibacillus sp. HJGM_3 TaxID=3379816 RepID=UPI00385A7618
MESTQPVSPAETSYEIRLLEPADLRFRRSDGGVLTLEYKEERHPEVLLYRTYPLSRHEQYLSVRSGKGEEIGVLERLSDLDPESQAEARKELKLRYLVPSVTSIVRIKQYPGMWVWDLQTTLGPIKMSMRNLHEHIQAIGSDRLLLSDIDGNRCEIFSIEALDANSRKILSRII